MEDERDVMPVVMDLIDFHGEGPTAERLGITPEELRRVMIGEAELDDEAVAAALAAAAVINDAMEQVGLLVEEDSDITEPPLAIPDEDDELQFAKFRVPELVGGREPVASNGTRGQERLANLYDQRLAGLRCQRDLTLSDDEVLEFKIFVQRVELQIIWDMEESLPVAGMGWGPEKRDAEGRRRLNEMQRLHRQRNTDKGGLRGLVRRFMGKHQERRQVVEEGVARERRFVAELMARGTASPFDGDEIEVESGALESLWDVDGMSPSPSGAD